jgi:hypothetical protein
MKSGYVRNGKYSSINFRMLLFHIGNIIHTNVKQPTGQDHYLTQNKRKFRGLNEEKLN